MRTAILQSPGRFTLESRPAPDPGPGEILVRTSVCGICTSEVGIWEGKAPGLEYPRFIGHEPSGVVEAVGDGVRSFSPGDHVSVWSEGKSFAEYFVAPAEYAFRLRKETPMHEALGEPIACAVNGALKAEARLNDSVCIVGCGFMGLMMMQVFRARGAGMLIAVDSRESILSLAGDLGATHALNPARCDVRKAVKEITGGRGVDIGVEAAGKQETLDVAGDVTRMEGTLEVFGYHQGGPRSVPWGYWNWMAFRIVNGHVRSAQLYVEGMTTGLKMLEAGTLKMGPLVTHRFPLEEINQGFETASAKAEGFVKGVVTL